jgi:polyhydroxybutyrate depolymerase
MARRDLLLAAAMLAAVGRSLAASPAADAPPCRGCVVIAPKARARPLLVLLHGDRQSPATLAAAFRSLAVARDLAVFAPACPADRGCDARSFWRWNGDPAWLDALVDDVAARYDVDRDRIWLVGWSGGASYMGARIADLGARYAALGFLGGGMVGDGCASDPLPAYFLVGDANPLHHLARTLRAALERCGHDVTWTLLPGADHGAEWDAVVAPARQRALLDFLAAHPRT